MGSEFCTPELALGVYGRRPGRILSVFPVTNIKSRLPSEECRTFVLHCPDLKPRTVSLLRYSHRNWAHAKVQAYKILIRALSTGPDKAQGKTNRDHHT